MRVSLESPPRETRRARLRRRVHLLPHLFTIGNLFAGYFAVGAVLAGQLDRAAMAMLIGFLLDSLDGAVARLVRAPSRIGVQLDSLADVVTFGIAPAMLAFVWGASAVTGPDTVWAVHIRRMAWIASFAFLAAGALRLARFNVMSSYQEEAPVPARRHAYVGMPIPVAAMCVAAVVHLVKSPVQEWWVAVVWLVYLFTLAGLMVSRMPFPHFRQLLSNPRYPHLLMLVAALLLAAVYYYSEIVLYSLLVVYLSAVVATDLRRRRSLAGDLNGATASGV